MFPFSAVLDLNVWTIINKTKQVIKLALSLSHLVSEEGRV